MADWPDLSERYQLEYSEWRHLSETFGRDYARRVHDTLTWFLSEGWEGCMDVVAEGGDVLVRRRDTVALALVPFELDPEQVLARALSFQDGYRPSWTFVVLPCTEEVGRWPILDFADRPQLRFPEYLRIAGSHIDRFPTPKMAAR